MARMHINLPPDLSEEEEKKLRIEIYKLISRAHPEKRIILELFESDTGLSLTAIQTKLRQMGIQRQKENLKNFAEKCGLSCTD